MKLILSFTAVLTLVANLALATPPSVLAKDMNCPDQLAAGAIPFLRADKNKADHFYSTDLKEINQLVTASNYTTHGSVGRIFSSQKSGTLPLYRLSDDSHSDHYYTIDLAQKLRFINQLGFQDKGIAGYVLQNNLCRFAQYRVSHLRRLQSRAETAHLLTHDVQEELEALNAGYFFDGPAGYVLV